MLETKNLVKIYRPKKGVPVTALNNVSLKFPDTGMVFLLGKSGSGKSTLLNVLGGLDRYNEGEILIKGQSSKTFSQQHFDSYRNTYVGFIFQEYNILDEFSVGTNIALALQLQGIKPTSEQINDILREVDLDGYGNRKPNELSGGQKQRVAIARALVKSPKIIMADEPTGALDSVTGRQILTTLKKLSKDKLVIVVSHDREFAEQYADRIIELADGCVIRDVEIRGDAPANREPTPIYNDEAVSLPQGYQLTQEDEQAILAYIQRMVDSGKAPKIDLHDSQGVRNFQPTDVSRIHASTDGYHLIKSKLPLNYAFKMGASGLRHKKFRLVMTILLSCVAFILFGLADTIASYDYITTSVSSLSDPESQITYAALEKYYLVSPFEGAGYTYGEYATLKESDYAFIKERTGITMYPVYSSSASWYSGVSMDLGFYYYIPQDENGPFANGYNAYYLSEFSGYVEISQQLLTDLGATLVAGTLPEANSTQVAISTFALETFLECGYTADGKNVEKIHSAQDILGKEIQLDGITYTVCGVVDAGLDYSRYESLKEEPDRTFQFNDQVLRMALEQELYYCLDYSLSGLAMVGSGQIETIAKELSENRNYSNVFYLEGEGYFSAMADYGVLSQVDASSIVWLDGNSRTALADNEIILSEELYMEAIGWGGRVSEHLDFTAQYTSDAPDYSAIMALDLQLWVTDRSGPIVQDQQLPMRIVGIIPQALQSGKPYSHIVSDNVMAMPNLTDKPVIGQTIAAMPKSEADILRLVLFTATVFPAEGTDGYYFELQNPVSFELKTLDELFNILRGVFIGVGIAFVVFAALLFSNFIGTSIAYKKREIGILRAIGSRSNDVFRIFFAESFIIAMINFALSLTGTAVICMLINNSVRNQLGLLLTVLNVGFRQVALLLCICLAVAVVASFLPVRKIAAKRPIDAIQDR